MRLANRLYQSEAIHGGRGYPGIYRALREGPSTLLVLPTGCGKTVVFSRVVEACVARGRRALIVAHREELIDSAYEKLVSATSVDRMQVGVEMAGDRAGDHHRVVIASVATLQKRRLSRIDPSDFGLVVIDEAHHAVAKTYRNIIDHFQGAKLLGVTATPERLDGRGIGRVFGSLAYVYEMAEAIRDGFLVDVVGEEVMGGDVIDLSDVRITAGDFNASDLAAVMERDPAVALVAKSTVDKAGSRPTIVFCSSVAQASATADYMNTYLRALGRRPSALAIDGEATSDQRRDAKRRLESGDVQYVCNCDLYTEGVDIPSVSCVAVARLTRSKGKYIQMVGRGTRLLGATIEESIAYGKEDLLVLDFIGLSKVNKLVSVFDILDGNADEEVRRRVIERASAGRPVNVMEQLELVSQEMLEEQRRRALEDVQYRSVAMSDPFAILGVHPRAGRHGGRLATISQMERLARHKIPGAEQQLLRMAAGKPMAEETFDYGQAQDVLASIYQRFRLGRCSIRVARILLKHGLNPDVPVAKAKWAMDLMAANQWQPTPEVLADEELRPGPR